MSLLELGPLKSNDESAYNVLSLLSPLSALQLATGDCLLRWSHRDRAALPKFEWPPSWATCPAAYVTRGSLRACEMP
jgi:hypothetical protein